MPTRRASAVWEGKLRDGKGSFNTESALGGQYSFPTRFENGKGSNPEELLAAAQASCYSMALSGALEKNGTPPTRIETNAACTIEPSGSGFKITSMRMEVRAKVPNIDPAKFQELAEATKTGCPVSGAFAGNLDLQVDAKLV